MYKSDLKRISDLASTWMENAMVKMQGYGWTAWKDEEKNSFTAETSVPGAYNLYQIDSDIFERLGSEELDETEKYRLIHDGRHLYMSVDDRCGPPYDIVFDEDYEKICPWAKVVSCGMTWPTELTDAAVEIFASEEDNRQQRREKRRKREKESKP